MFKGRFLGVGSPLLDILAAVNDDFLARVPGEKGGMRMMSAADQTRLIDMLPADAIRRSPGGSAGNTVFALARLGMECALLGKLGNDDNGRFYRNRLVELGGSDEAFFTTNDAPTGTCLSLITPDAERTMRSCLAASLLLTPEEIRAFPFHNYSVVYIEGFMIYTKVFDTILECAKRAGCRIGLDLASFEVVRSFRDRLTRLIRDFVDIIMANEAEAAELVPDAATPEAQLDRLAEWSGVVALKRGRLGAMVRRGNELAVVPACTVAKPVDTTGAGDLWAAGFLYGELAGRPLKEAARMGALAAAEVVKVYGSEMPAAVWKNLKKRLMQ
ncbi:MAG: adenosine kinase [Victivallaceae bacterium]|nr:adenosine kinase [Victivallaceae bacterium]